MADTAEVDFVRPYNHARDNHVVKMLIGQGVMEGLARANSSVYSHPLTLFVWPVLALALCGRFNWVPVSGQPLTYPTPLIGFALIALPFMAVVEYFQRPGFTARMRQVLGAPDMIQPERYYAQGGIWVFEHKDEVVGVVCLDQAKAGEALGSVLGEEETVLADKSVGKSMGLRDRPKRGQTRSETAQIRHLDVDFTYRKAGVGTELLVTALDHAFEVNATKRAVILTNPFAADNELHKCGFAAVTETDGWESPAPLGLLGKKGKWMGVSRETYIGKRATVFTK